jgi:pimeloyl-ACP methyl ester carboxylesterase
MTLSVPSAQEWKQRCQADGEFTMAARHWNGGLTLKLGDESLSIYLNDGVLADSTQSPEGVLTYCAENPVWEKLLAAVPERFHNDLMANMSTGNGVSRQGDELVHAQYFAAATRAVELLRPVVDLGEAMPHDKKAPGVIDAPVGRYVHLDIGGHDHRIYFEEAGQGIPVLLQHTAGAHGSQWRHLFEIPEITDRFRLIAYDLPYHGKSVPPVSRSWWEEKYDLKGEYLRSIPVKLAEVLGLDQPVFMGCSVGGLLALDLAHKHPDVFRAVISVEGALNIAGKMADFDVMWHPQVSNEYKARMMDGVMSPTSPKAYRKETSFVYSSGWPPAFVGDLHYYVADYDLREKAHEIDTNEVGVHILNGEYDYSGSSELGQQANAAIKGSTWSEMKGVGHFPMSENPEAFLNYLLPILGRIAA